MLVVRSIMQAKFGYGGHLAAAATEGSKAAVRESSSGRAWHPARALRPTGPTRSPPASSSRAPE